MSTDLAKKCVAAVKTHGLGSKRAAELISKLIEKEVKRLITRIEHHPLQLSEGQLRVVNSVGVFVFNPSPEELCEIYDTGLRGGVYDVVYSYKNYAFLGSFAPFLASDRIALNSLFGVPSIDVIMANIS